MKKLVAMLLWAAMLAGVFSGCAGEVPASQNVETTEPVPVTTWAAAETEVTEQTQPPATEPLTALDNGFRIALIAGDRFERIWVALEAGAMKAAEELGCEVINMSPVMRHDGQQAEQITKAAAEGFDAIVVAAMDSEPVAEALKAAMDAGVKIVCVDTAAEVETDALVCSDDKAAGRTAGETLIAALEQKGITEGSVGVIAVNKDTEFSVQREAGFREVLKDSGYILLETQYSEGDAAKAHAIAQSYLEQAAAGIFCCSEGCMIGAGNAVKETGAETAVVGFGEARLEEGYVSAVLVKDHSAMGHTGVNTACGLLHGREPGDDIMDVGVLVLAQ